MKSFIIRLRNWKIALFYRYILKPIYFSRDPEDVHDSMLKFGVKLGRSKFWRAVLRLYFGYSHEMLSQNVLGIDFENPIGLAAGFDKNAELLNVLPSVGFGFAEVGSVTGEYCEGNPRPRLWRLVKSRSLVVYYGLKNDGAVEISNRLQGKRFEFPFGVSLAKTNCKETVELEPGIRDYVKGFKEFISVGDYITINISCPNVFGGQPFHDAKSLEALFSELDKVEVGKPVLVKISPDLEKSQVDDILEVAKKHRVDGFVISNLTKKRDNKNIIDKDVPDKGGFSGKVMIEEADDLISYVYKKEGHRFTIIGCGGVFTASDAYKKIRLGASLVQMITGMIYSGPQVVSSINEGLVRLLKKDGFMNIEEAIGVDNKER